MASKKIMQMRCKVIKALSRDLDKLKIRGEDFTRSCVFLYLLMSYYYFQ